MRLSRRENYSQEPRPVGLSMFQRAVNWVKKIKWKSIRAKVQDIDWTPCTEPRFIIAGSTAATFLVLTSGFIISNMNQTQAWKEVFTNGNYVGLVPSKPSTLAAMKRTAEGYNVDLQFDPVHKDMPASYSWRRVTTLPEKAYAVTLNGSPLVYTHGPANAHQVVDKVKSALLPKHLQANATVQFSGKVAVQETFIGVAHILSTEAAVQYLLNPGEGVATSSRSVNLVTASQAVGNAAIKAPNYTVQRSNVKTFSTAASTAAVTAKNAALPAKQASRQDSSFATARPLITVQASEVVQKKVKEKYPVKRIKDSRLGYGTVKVVTKGKPGTVQEKVRQVYKNGKLVSHKVLGKTVLSKPATQVEDVGTNRGIATGRWIWPVPSSHIITSGYGPRYLFGRWGFHPGIDIGCPVGTPIVATNDGVVEVAGWNSGGYGNWIKINNGNGIESVFGHLSRIKVHAGETVAKGQIIGYSGDTGLVTGPHLHYEIRKYGHHINPMPYA